MFHLLRKAILSFELRIKYVRSALKLHKTEGKLMRPRETGRKNVVTKNRETGGSRNKGAKQGVRLYYEGATEPVVMTKLTDGNDRKSGPYPLSKIPIFQSIRNHRWLF